MQVQQQCRFVTMATFCLSGTENKVCFLVINVQPSYFFVFISFFTSMSFDQEQESFSFVDEYTHLLTELHESYCQDQPADVLQYCANFFNKKLEEQRSFYFREHHFMGTFSLLSYLFIYSLLSIILDTEHHPLAMKPNPYEPTFMDSSTSFEQDEDVDIDNDDEDEEDRDKFTTAPLIAAPPNYNRNRRTSVSAESMAPTQGFVKKVIPKTPRQVESIQQSVSHNFLFKNLDEEHSQDVVDAMVETHVERGKTIIEQGDVGDFFYVVQSGTFDCFIQDVKVTEYEAGGSFGELALMYNAPRAATIIATSDSIVWALDRVTFRTILMENTSRKRKMYEAFLEEVPLLKSLEPYERHKIADALESVYIQDGEHVVLQGDVGDQFYIIEAGSALVYKVDSNGDQQEVNQLERGAYFGGKISTILIMCLIYI